MQMKMTMEDVIRWQTKNDVDDEPALLIFSYMLQKMVKYFSTALPDTNLALLEILCVNFWTQKLEQIDCRIRRKEADKFCGH